MVKKMRESVFDVLLESRPAIDRIEDDCGVTTVFLVMIGEDGEVRLLTADRFGRHPLSLRVELLDAMSLIREELDSNLRRPGEAVH